MNKSDREEAIEANIYVHSFLAAAGEYNKSPHFLPENQEKVRNILLGLAKKCKGNGKAIDFGCGTGFIIHLIYDLFEQIHGVDITQEMMRQVNTGLGNIVLHESIAEKTPFESETFDIATAYSFMDHLVDYEEFLREAYRVLKFGGIFYSDLNPNRDFIMAVTRVEQLSNEVLPITPIVKKEVQGALHNGDLYKNSYGMDGKLLEKAEPIKTRDKGFCALEVLQVARKIGFKDVKVEYEWYLGQAKVMHQQSRSDSNLVENYLNDVLPLSSSLFKYLRFIFVK